VEGGEGGVVEAPVEQVVVLRAPVPSVEDRKSLPENERKRGWGSRRFVWLYVDPQPTFKSESISVKHD